ncbi:hypothetical protein QFC19_008439 [Naganishia cerealis]|uniref:Uncharacterized protein n=1 Tax=Naganishia cerealis TaxID=610337 RepID=A0ACC2V1L6_9TREE|nr:hypothetical protein QFC19_008439 [Naganishia cerealis]
MNPILDLIGTSSPPSSPPCSPTATQGTRPRSTKLKRLTSLSAVPQNGHAIQEGVKDAMEENPSFRSPSRSLFQGNTTDVHFPDTMSHPPPSDITHNTALCSPRSSQEEHRLTTPTPASRPQSSSATAESPVAASHDSKTSIPVHVESPAHPRGSNNIGRLGYRHSTIGPVSRTPQPHARRARRRSISRERVHHRGGIPVDDGSSSGGGGATAPAGGGNDSTQSPSSDISSRPSAASLSRLPSTLPSSQVPPTGPLTLIEKHASLLAYIAHKETEVHEARRTWERRKAELEELKKRWEVVIARQGFHSTTTPSTATTAATANGAPLHGVTGRQAPIPIRRTGSTSSAGSSHSASLLRPTTNGEARDGVLPLTIPPTGPQQQASGSSRATLYPSISQAYQTTPHPQQQQGSRSLFGHLLDSLSGITSDLVPREAQDVNGGGGVSGVDPAEGRNALVVLDEYEGVRDTSAEGGGRKVEQRQGQGRTGTGTRQIKTLSLIAGMGSAAAASAKHRHVVAVAAGDGDKTDHESSPGQPNNAFQTTADRAASSSRENTVTPPKWNLMDDSSPARARWNSSMDPSGAILPVDEMHAAVSTNKVEASSSSPSAAASFTGGGAGGGGGMVDFANIWDGFATPQGGKDWKERLGNVMGVASPTSHTLEFFSQALPTPNLNALGRSSSLTSTTTGAREADPSAASTGLPVGPVTGLPVGPVTGLPVGPVRPSVSSRQGSGQGKSEPHPENDKGRQEDDDGSSAGMDIPWNCASSCLAANIIRPSTPPLNPPLNSCKMSDYNYEKDVQASYGDAPALAKADEQVVSQQGYNSLSERRRAALEEIDNASFNRFHVKACAVAGVGFFTDAYDIFAISMAATMIGYVYGHGGKNSNNQDLGIKVAHSIGTFCGQLLFGWLADVVGRKRMYGLELIIIIIGTLGQAVAGRGPGVNIYGVIIMWRFVMGLGIGGDYPLSAVITSEFASKRIRGRMMTAVFACQGWGNLAAAIVAICVVSGFKKQILHDDLSYQHVDYCWRILIGLGCVPGAIALYFRLTIPETPRYTMDIERNVKQAAQDVDTYLTTGHFVVDPDAPVQRVDAPKATTRDFWAHFGQWKHGKVLLGCAWSWFALDIAFYGLGLNSSIVLTQIGFGSATTGTAAQKVYTNLHNVAVGNIILAVAGLIPGYWASFLLIDKVGRKPIQFMGFIILTGIFCGLGFGYHKLTASTSGRAGFVALYCLANFFQNFGPNTTTFVRIPDVIPGEIAPTRYRSTFHGISAASGKLGAIVAQVGFAKMIDIGGKTGSKAFLPHILEIFALFMATGVVSTMLIPESMGRSLEDLSGEDQEHFIHEHPEQKETSSA